MALTYGTAYIEPIKGEKGGILGINVRQQVVWDGTLFSAVIPGARAEIERIQDLAAGRPLKLKWIHVYYPAAMTLDAAISICSDMGQSAAGVPLVIALDNIQIRSDGTYAFGSLNRLDVLMHPAFSKLAGETGSAATSRSLVILNFLTAGGAPDNTESTYVAYQLEVVK